MSKNKEQSLNIISKKFGNMEEKKSFKELSIALEESIKEISGAEYGFILILDKDISLKITKEESILKTVLLSEKPLFENYVVKHKKYNQKIDNPLEIEIKSMLIVPIFNRERTTIIGFIQAINSVKNSVEFGRYDLRILTLLESYARQIFERDNNNNIKKEPNLSTLPVKTVRRKTKSELEAELKLYEKKIQELKKELNSKEERETYNEIKTILNFLTNEILYFANKKHHIYLFLEIIKNSLHSEEQLALIDNSLEKSLFLKELTQELYSVEKLPLNHEYFHTSEAISNVVNLYSHEFSKRDITFNIFIDPQLPDWLIGDENKIKSLMVHLLNNLYGLVENGGAIEVSVSFSTKENRLNIKLKGLLPHKLTEIKKFFKNRKVSHSLTTSNHGLGLGICSNLVNILGAKLKLTTKGGEEQTFTVNIPLSLEPNQVEKNILYTPIKVGILMNELNLYAYQNIKRYLLSFGIEEKNIFTFKNHKKMNSTTFFHLICFENMLSEEFDMSRFNSISILKYNSERSRNSYGKGIEVNELYINSYYGMTLQKILFPESPVEVTAPRTLLIKDSFFTKVINKLKF